MTETIGRRIKLVRNALELSQRNFSLVLSISHSYIAGIETGAREINNRIIKLIVSEFGVNETWLTTGAGEMFSQNPDEQFTKLVKLFKELPPKYQELIFQMIELLLKAG